MRGPVSSAHPTRYHASPGWATITLQAASKQSGDTPAEAAWSIQGLGARPNHPAPGPGPRVLIPTGPSALCAALDGAQGRETGRPETPGERVEGGGLLCLS